MERTEMRSLLDEIAKLAQLVYSKESFWGLKEVTFRPPATAKQIQALDGQMPFRLPASYLTFLSITNGCTGFWPDYTLLGSEGEPYDLLVEKIADAKEEDSKYAADDHGKVTLESIKAFEAQEVPEGTPPYYFIAAHTVFGTNCAGEFLLFDEKILGKNSEASVVWYSFDGRVEERFEGFDDFVTKTRTKLQRRIAEKKY